MCFSSINTHIFLFPSNLDHLNLSLSVVSAAKNANFSYIVSFCAKFRFCILCSDIILLCYNGYFPFLWGNNSYCHCYIITYNSRKYRKKRCCSKKCLFSVHVQFNSVLWCFFFLILLLGLLCCVYHSEQHRLLSSWSALHEDNAEEPFIVGPHSFNIQMNCAFCDTSIKIGTLL